ncbi:ATP-dependent DNA helicase [Streptomyces globosus]|uniref:ATP-dependent DNA helicase n=1 Tax=Streptomyces globosus TaxID=68209 RepID=UPI0031E136FA
MSTDRDTEAAAAETPTPPAGQEPPGTPAPDAPAEAPAASDGDGAAVAPADTGPAAAGGEGAPSVPPADEDAGEDLAGKGHAGGADSGRDGGEPYGTALDNPAAPGHPVGGEAGEDPAGSGPDDGADSGRGGGEPQDAAGGGGPDAPASDGAGADGGTGGEAAQLSEAEAELAAQRYERERIARRKAERQAPVEAGGKLSGKAADLLAAVRVVEGGASAPAYFDDAPAVPRRPAPEAPAARAAEPAPQPPRPRPEAAAPAAPPAERVEAVRAVLARGGAPAELAAPAAAALGEDAAEQLAEDPWRLLAVAGVRPNQADGFARALLGPGAGPDDERRAAALTGWLLEQAALKGHTALEAPALESALAGYGVPAPAEALGRAIAEGLVLVFHEPVAEPAARAAQPADSDADAEQPVRVLVGLEGHALAEESLADGLARLTGTFTGEGAAAWDPSAVGAGVGAELVRAAAAHGLVVHTGGEAARAEPLALAAAAREHGLRTCLAAHAPAPGAVTVAGLLAGAEGPDRDADGRFALDLLVVLDAPQLDVETAAALVESVPDGARLVLSGDPGVLGSAGPGRVFADVLAARVCPQVASRLPDPGPIGELVSGIGIGELNQVEAPGREVVIVPVRDAGEAVHRTVQLVAESVPRAFGIVADGVQVITPGHGGSAGTRALNAALKERLNPGPGRFGGFDPGDRVVHVPSPGRAVPARVVSADAAGLQLDAAGGRVVVPKELVESRVRHGWAVTAHQAVGGRWPAVVVVLPGDAVPALSRDWVYTAFGRAERHLSVVHGVDQALPRAVAEVLPKPRTTRLAGLLRSLAAAAQEQPE